MRRNRVQLLQIGRYPASLHGHEIDAHSVDHRLIDGNAGERSNRVIKDQTRDGGHCDRKSERKMGSDEHALSEGVLSCQVNCERQASHYTKYDGYKVPLLRGLLKSVEE